VELRQEPSLELSVVWAVYGQPQIMAKQWEQMRSVHYDVAKHVELVVVDDHGTPPADIPSDVRAWFRHHLIRLKRDVPWNQMGARNTGAYEARGRVVLFLDPDMVLDDLPAFLEAARKLGDREVVQFAMRHQNGRINMTSPNTWLIPRALFLEVGGYDEDYAGNKGWSDVQLMHVLNSWPDCKMIRRKDLAVDFWLPEDGVQDAQVKVANGVNRDYVKNAALHKQKRKRVETRFGGNWARWVKSQKDRATRRVPYETVSKD
jgi:hypothetical protein